MSGAHDPFSPDEIKFRWNFLYATLVLGAGLGALFLTFPSIDLKIAASFKGLCHTQSDRGWCRDPFVLGLRHSFMVLFASTCVVAAAGLAYNIRKAKMWVGLDQSRWLFLALVLSAGPGLVANTLFKDNWGRARPRDVIELGGAQTFSPPLFMARECPKNCSFVSGEASSSFAPLFAAALVLPQYRAALIGSAIVSGLITGVVRMSEGGHFLSDVVFAGIFMALTVSALHSAVFALWRALSRLRPDDWARVPWLQPQTSASSAP
jgi:lipid A 4'-phosphatase